MCFNMDNLQVVKAEDSIGPEVEKLVASLPDGGVLLLENVRFYKEEEKERKILFDMSNVNVVCLI